MKTRHLTVFFLPLLATATTLYAQVRAPETDPYANVETEPRANVATGAAGEDTSIVGVARGRIPGPAEVLPADAWTEFQKFVASATGQPLSIYGASLFHNVPTTFAPSDLAPAPSDYMIGPEDELRVRIWGGINYTGNLRVDRSGNVYLPEVGSVHVAGLKFAELDQHVRAAVARVYRNFDLTVDMGRIRSMQVYVTGQARRPGVYTVSSLSTLVDALFASGGPSPLGSLRHVVLKRDGKEIADFDLYALLMHGDKSHDVHLLPEDVLYIAPSGPQVAITGSIRNEGIYELRGGETIADLLELAGKPTVLASNGRIALERVGADKHRQAMEFALDGEGTSAPLLDADILRIYSILPSYRNTVVLRGNLANPGRYSFKPGMHVSDLIPDRESLQSRDYWWKRSHLGLPVAEFEAQIPGAPNTLTPALKANDAQGALPGSGGQSADRMSGNGAIAERMVTAGSNQVPQNTVNLTTPEIDWDFAVIERRDPETMKTSLLAFDLGKLVLSHDASQDLALQPGDTITIFSQGDIRPPLDRQTKYVEVAGEVLHGGIYSVEPGETLRDVVRRAGGLTGRAYLYGSEFSRESVRVLQQQRIEEYAQSVSIEADRASQELAISTASSSSATGPVNVAENRVAQQSMLARLSRIRATGRVVMQFAPTSRGLDDIPALNLENGDRFVVPFAPATVNVVGAVYDQNSFLYAADRTVGRYLLVAGGPTRSADMRRAFVIRADGSVVNRASVKGVWGNSFDKLHLNPGDTVVVPEKMLRPSRMKTVMDWTQMFSQLAIGAAVANNL